MATEIDRKAIRAKVEHALSMPLRFQHEVAPGPATVLALLDALAEAEAERDRWKARAEKLAQGSTERYWQEIDGGREA